MKEPSYTCPCCGYIVFDEKPGSFEICPICFWEDDISQLRFYDMGGGANEVSLIKAQKNFMIFGACEEKHKTDVRPPGKLDRRDQEWRPIDPAKDKPERIVAGMDYGPSYPSDATGLYYWK